MEQRIVSQEENRYIYFIEENNIGFYLAIPRAREVSLVLNLMENIDDLKIKQLPFNQNDVYVCPVINGNILEGLLQNQSAYFQATDEAFSKALNLAHKILTYNHLNVNNSIYLNENEKYSMFCQWFINKYQGRVVLKQNQKPIEEVITEPPIPKQNIPVQTQVQEEIVPQTIPEHPQEPINNMPEKGGLGFVSYVLLGVVVAVASLLFLYFML